MRLARLHGNECVDDRVELELVAARGHTAARQQCSREKENERRSTMHHGACFRWRQEASDPENVHAWPPRPPRNSIARAKTAGNALRPRPAMLEASAAVPLTVALALALVALDMQELLDAASVDRLAGV